VRAPALPAALALALALAACGGERKPALAAAPGWIDVAGMVCADGSPTGIGILPGRSDAVLVYLAGGGACWGDAPGECNDSTRSFGQTEFEELQLLASGTIFDRTLAGNPFATWTVVFVPYCTGDVHAGDSIRIHAGASWNHHGWRNLHAAFDAAAATLPRPAELVVAGSSAGGFGALAGYDLIRATWDPEGGTTAALVDDSGPTPVGTTIPPPLLSSWWEAWGLASTVGVACTTGCEQDLSELWRAPATRYSGDRVALMTTIYDGTMRGFFGDPSLGSPPPAMSQLEFQAALGVLADKLAGMRPQLDAAPIATFQVGGDAAYRHALLIDQFFLGPGSAQGPPALQWLSDMVAGRPWSSAGP
jgi:hypothetical protein